jgi:hypothetical protein
MLVVIVQDIQDTDTLRDCVFQQDVNWLERGEYEPAETESAGIRWYGSDCWRDERL